MNKLKESSHLNEVLSIIKSAASSGLSETGVSNLGKYDKVKLKELGFKINLQNETMMVYTVSWEE